jgi:hypothetical protein
MPPTAEPGTCRLALNACVSADAVDEAGAGLVVVALAGVVAAVAAAAGPAATAEMSARPARAGPDSRLIRWQARLRVTRSSFPLTGTT